jgi:hypothetical protein
MRALQALDEERSRSKRWQFTFAEFLALCIKGGAIDADKPANIQRARASDLRTQLANRGAIKVDGDTIRIVASDA